MYRDEDPDDAPVFYIFVILAVLISTIYGLISLFTGATEEGIFILTVSAIFYVALYFRFFPSENTFR